MNSHLLKKIKEGEHQQQDFKYCINDSRKIAKSLVAFANTDGGRLLIGVKDNGRVVGIQTDEEYYMVEAAAKIYSKPAIIFTTQQWQFEGKTVLEIWVDPSNQKPHFAKDENGKWLAYIRIDDENFLAHKILVNVWKNKSNPNGVHFSYSENEKFLIEYLQENESVSISKFIRKAHVSRLKAEEILTNFATMEVIVINTTKQGTTFSLNKTLGQTELQKFKS